jgi:hypothetical protein
MMTSNSQTLVSLILRIGEKENAQLYKIELKKEA